MARTETKTITHMQGPLTGRVKLDEVGEPVELTIMGAAPAGRVEVNLMGNTARAGLDLLVQIVSDLQGELP